MITWVRKLAVVLAAIALAVIWVLLGAQPVLA
jgi:hypothetical protein